MKRIHIRKPDIKGFFVKVRNLKKEDIKRHFQEKKERRQRILEERRNSKIRKKDAAGVQMDEPVVSSASFSARLRHQFSD